MEETEITIRVPVTTGARLGRICGRNRISKEELLVTALHNYLTEIESKLWAARDAADAYAYALSKANDQ